jgi:predicted oxidoreductase
MAMDADVIIVGGGLSGLVASHELLARGLRVLLVEQEPEQSLGGQAFWSLGGLFMVNTPLQRRMGIRDSHELALQDWMGTAGFDRKEDEWPRKWAQAYIDFAAGEKYSWLRGLGIRFFPIVGWAERGNGVASGRGNSVPRFHVTWGAGPGVLEPFLASVGAAVRKGSAVLRFRHRVDELIVTGGAVTGVRGCLLEPSDIHRGEGSSRKITGEFEYSAQAVIVASGGIGANLDLVRTNWPRRLGLPPGNLLCGVPEHVDGRMLGIAQRIGGNVINSDRMWHYTEGVANWNPIWKGHGIRILPGPSSLWFDATGKRLPAPFFPGFDTLGTLEYLRHTGYDHSWFILNQKIIRKEFSLSGSEQNPDLTGRNWGSMLGRAFGKHAPGPVEAFKSRGADFIVKPNLRELVEGMNALVGLPLLQYDTLLGEIMARDMEAENKFGKDLQVAVIRTARKYKGDRLTRAVPVHKILDPAAGPLIAVRLHILTRKTLGGLETNLDGQILDGGGTPITGLYGVGEAAGFGGGGMHGYSSLEGSFLGGCLFSGRTAGRALAKLLLALLIFVGCGLMTPCGLFAQVANHSPGLFPRKYMPGDKYRYQLTCEESQNGKWTTTTVSICELSVTVDSSGTPWDEVHWISVRRYAPGDTTDQSDIAQSLKPYRISLHPRGGMRMPPLTIPQMTEPITDFQTFFVAVAPVLGSVFLKKVGDKHTNSWPIIGDFSNGKNILKGQDCLQTSVELTGERDEGYTLLTSFMPPAKPNLTYLVPAMDTPVVADTMNNFQMVMPVGKDRFNIQYGREFFQINSIMAKSDGKLLSAKMINWLTLKLQTNCDSTYQHCRPAIPYEEERILTLTLLHSPN